ncbi:MAG: hypothetical protein WC575_00970 [Patescibacteria group bacterium]
MRSALMLLPAAVWLILSALFFAGGEFLSKKWGIKPSLEMTLLVVAVYAMGTVMWLPALLHKNQIATMGTIWLLLATVATVSIGVFIYHESLNPQQWIGVVLALVALGLLGA